MTVYSYAQMEELWIQAGGSRALAPIAAAIAEAESGGNSDALNPNDNNGTQSSFGLWQISNGTHTPPSPNWANPAVNAQLAVGKWQSAGGFSPWGTYDSGAYKAYLSNSTTPDPNVPGSPTQTDAQTAAAGEADCAFPPGGFQLSLPVIGGIGGSVCLITKSELRSWYGALLLVGGSFLVIIGLGFTVAFTGPGRKVLTIITKAPAMPSGGGSGKPQASGSQQPPPSPAAAPATATAAAS